MMRRWMAVAAIAAVVTGCMAKQGEKPEEKRVATVESRLMETISQGAPAGWKKTGMTRERYLDIMERIITIAAEWQDERGAIIDPVTKAEWAQTSPRFVAPGAILLSAGRVPQLREKVLRGMDYSCMRLARREAKSPDFWMRELMTAWHFLKDTDPERRKRWEEDIRSVDPEKTNAFVSPDGSKIKEFHNWVVYGSAGEAMRQAAGLGPRQRDEPIVWGAKFFEKYMPAQLEKFSELGMYRDPDDPFTYDVTTRLQIMTAFAYGFDSPLKAEFDDLLRRGALAQLLYVSPGGFVPFGGRSAQMQLQEAICAAVCELEARRYKTSKPELARAFKRMAHLHTKAIERWMMEMTPPRHIKNGFAAETNFGCDSYGKVSVYSCFTASCLGLAWQFADDSIDEGVAPAEVGGYALTLSPAFHKVFATCAGTQIEIDLAADSHYDATGLGRFVRAGVPIELGLGMPIAKSPKYELPAKWNPAEPLAIGPRWKKQGKWISLAGLSKDAKSTVAIERESREEVVVRVTWDAAGTTVNQRYRLTEGKVEIEATATGTEQIAMTVPLLVTDGASKSQVAMRGGNATVEYLGGRYVVQFSPAYAMRTDGEVANRNGVYEILAIETSGPTIAVTLELQRR